MIGLWLGSNHSYCFKTPLDNFNVYSILRTTFLERWFRSSSTYFRTSSGMCQNADFWASHPKILTYIVGGVHELGFARCFLLMLTPMVRGLLGYSSPSGTHTSLCIEIKITQRLANGSLGATSRVSDSRI